MISRHEELALVTKEILKETKDRNKTIKISLWANGDIKKLNRMLQIIKTDHSKPIDCIMADIIAEEQDGYTIYNEIEKLNREFPEE